LLVVRVVVFVTQVLQAVVVEVPVVIESLQVKI
jgi:hypothetical protein